VRILVCVKRVPITGGRMVLTDDAQALETKHLGFTISPHEECGVDEAVRIVETQGGSSAVLTLGPAERFGSGKQVGSYFGLIPSEESSGGKQRLGRISKQGSSFLRFLLVEAGQTAARLDPQLKRFYRRLAVRKNRSIAKVAVARKLATRLYLMLREDWTYAQLNQAVMQVSPSHSVAGQ